MKTVYNANVYDEAVKTLAEQIAAMVREDGGDEFMAHEYIGDTIKDITDIVHKEIKLDSASF